jgi:phytanoyl-CoA dioxygenase PhyH
MTTRLSTRDPAASVGDVVAAIERDGAVVVDGFLPSEVHARLAVEVEDAMARVSTGESSFDGRQTRRFGAVLAKCPTMREVALHPSYLGASRAILQAKPFHCWIGETRMEMTPDIQVGVTQGIRIEPGQGAQPLHRDDLSFFWQHPTYGREGRVQIMVAISDFTAANGATRVIPGSNHWDDERVPLQAETVPAEMRAGSALIWVGSTYHGGGQNTTDASRTGVIMSYDLANLRQEENQYLALPLEAVREMPEELQRLVGYSSGSNYMGYVEVGGKYVDPHYLVAADGVLQNSNAELG